MRPAPLLLANETHIADVSILSAPDKNNGALEILKKVVNCERDKKFSAHLSC